jgi:hypothetical protein
MIGALCAGAARAGAVFLTCGNERKLLAHRDVLVPAGLARIPRPATDVVPLTLGVPSRALARAYTRAQQVNSM